ncbi:MAG TPA: TetR/AcrR family transcriptional regulator [Spirochaetota bacterium]|nr:TetR/AcrR family transcriptional regulator [Spirochaetota bacterium]HNT09618.1 TetR/AcrR family transcriptional regulator [Spirochaetota bacterium]HNV47900.1 TetR/AcrR family transcriptional regulator [Spirochaetota bacterium]HOS39575.1 TetR/AcrR family transcriptional regulator [Spirochaetota bacterium]HPI21650.1 TetR/AcrR family transcriptional regulator [Spirochaetota bacterium]
MPAKGQRRKQQIIDTAKEMFIEKGFQSTHIGQVCKKLNIARGTVYQYFGNKREILYAVLDQIEEKIDDIMDQDDLRDFLKNNPNPKTHAKFIEDRLINVLRTIMDEPIVMKLIFKEVVGIDKEVVARVNKFQEYLATAVKNEVDEIIKKGIYKKTINPEIAAMLLVGGVMFILFQYESKQRNVLDREIIESIISTYLTGVLK